MSSSKGMEKVRWESSSSSALEMDIFMLSIASIAGGGNGSAGGS